MHENSASGHGYVICDSQVHAPDLPHATRVGGIDIDKLLTEMDVADVARCIIVPLEAPGSDQSANNPPALAAAQANPDRFAVIGRFDLTRSDNCHLLDDWLAVPTMLGIRLVFIREPNRSLFLNDEMEWFWSGAADAGIPVMMLAPGMLGKVAQLAARYPGLRITLDHMALPSHVVIDDLMGAIEPILGLARYPNVSVKASALPCATADEFPFQSLHEPILRVIDEYGPQRVFWGSDLTQLRCSYAECVNLFAAELPYRCAEDKEWVLGRGIMEWLGWDLGSAMHAR
jgi:L-fuconolactonase